MKHSLTPFLAAALLAGTAFSSRADHPVAREEIRPGSEPGAYAITQHNEAMHNAVLKARRTVGGFIQALKNPKPGQHDFEVKKPIHQGAVVEHIWLSDITFSGNRFHGYVDNKPRKIKGLHMGDRVSVNPCEISDWAFVENGRLVGGYTIRVIYWALPPDKRKQFENGALFRIR